MYIAHNNLARWYFLNNQAIITDLPLSKVKSKVFDIVDIDKGHFRF